MTETQALQRCQDGDREAFRHLVDRYQDLLFRTATLMTGSQSLAETQVREALRAAWRGIHAAGLGAPVKPWLIRILVGLEAARGPTSSNSPVRPSNRAPLQHLPSPRDPNQVDRERHTIRRALAALDPAHRHVLVLSYFADLTISQLALALGVPEHTVESRRRQALRQLREQLQPCEAHRADKSGVYASDQSLADALRTYFAAAAVSLRAPEHLWDTLAAHAQHPSCVTRIRRKVLAAAARFWTPVAATGGAVALASVVLCATTACSGPGAGDAEAPAAVAAPAPVATAAPAPAAVAAPAPPATAAPARATAAPAPAVVAAPAPPATAAPARATAAPAPAAMAAPAPAATGAPAVIIREVITEVPVEVEKLVAAPTGAAFTASAEKVVTRSDAESSAPRREYRPVDLTAGEVNDNEKWTEYLRYRDDYRGPPVHDVDVSERYTISVLDALGRPVPNAEVSVSAGQAPIFESRTYANGQTLFFPRAFPAAANARTFRLDVEKDGVIQSLDAERDQESEWVVRLDVDRSYGDRVPLDLLFLLDATGSMADEINQIKATLLSISDRIGDLPSRPDLRFGMVTYRDRGDDFVTRLYDFDADVPAFLGAIQDVVADGGGDDPESLNEALHEAVHRPNWRLDDAIRLIVLVADAPPHLDYAQDYDYAVEMIEANRRGMKIFSIASSGLDQQGEYIFRQLAQHTMGRFAFILYGGETSHSVSDYSVEQLDDLVVRLVQEELNHLKPA